MDQIWSMWARCVNLTVLQAMDDMLCPWSGCRCADEMTDGKWNKFRDDVSHDGHKIDWGKWAITGNDPVFGGSGNPDTGGRVLSHVKSYQIDVRQSY